MGVIAATAIGVSFVADAVFAELPSRVHPVAAFGRLIARFDRRWVRPRVAGVAVAVVLPVCAALAVGGATAIVAGVRPVFGGLLAAFALFSTTSLRMLVSVATTVLDATDTDPDRARESVRALVGRDTTALSPGELRSAAVESAAENLSDGLVAPLFGFVLGSQLSLPVGVALAVWVKAVNTLDSMLGYRSHPMGWASARLDDAVMWVPARLSALLIAFAGGSPAALARARAWHDEPPSPNAGWPMATLAAVLDVELRKNGVYVLNPGAGLPTIGEARRGTRIVGIAGVVAFVLAGVAAWF